MKKIDWTESQQMFTVTVSQPHRRSKMFVPFYLRVFGSKRSSWTPKILKQKETIVRTFCCFRDLFWNLLSQQLAWRNEPTYYPNLLTQIGTFRMQQFCNVWLIKKTGMPSFPIFPALTAVLSTYLNKDAVLYVLLILAWYRNCWPNQAKVLSLVRLWRKESKALTGKSLHWLRLRLKC